MSDIAERLKLLRERRDHPDRTEFGARQATIELSDIMNRNLDTIISALQFADGMQTLRQDPLFMMKTSIASGQIEILTSKGWVYGDDIFTAARNAVGKMEGK